MKTVTISKAVKELDLLIDETDTSHEPITIASRNVKAVLISEPDWNAIQETLYLLSIPKMRQSIAKGLKTPLSKCAETLKW